LVIIPTMTASYTGAASSRVLGVFAKWPQPGEVKTRLTPDSDRGAAVARAFLLDTLARLSGVAARRIVAFAPATAEAQFAGLVPSSLGLTPQPDGDLGQRLVGFLTQQLEAGAETIVVVGADSPTLPVEYVERAFAELERANVVLGPATDGGYYLLGCGRR